MTAQGILGDVLNIDRRLHTPAATSGSKAEPVDSGLIMIVDSNLSVVARESLHHLATGLGQGTLSASAVGRGFANLNDASQPSNPSGIDEIAWTIKTAMMFGPFDLCNDRVESDGNFPRKIVCACYAASAAASSLRLYAAVTQSPETPNDANVLAFGYLTASTLLEQQRITLVPRRFTPGQRRDRESLSSVSAFANLFVWLGWYATNAADRLYTVSVWESR